MKISAMANLFLFIKTSPDLTNNENFIFVRSTCFIPLFIFGIICNTKSFKFLFCNRQSIMV